MGGYCLCELLIGSWFHRLSPDIHRLTAGWETDCPSPISNHQAMCLALVAGLNEPLLTWGTDCGYGSEGVGMECWGTKHGMEMTKRTYRQRSTCKSFNYLFSFSAQLPGGGEFLWSFGQRSRLAGGFGAAIIHNVSLGVFFQGFIPRT